MLDRIISDLYELNKIRTEQEFIEAAAIRIRNYGSLDHCVALESLCSKVLEEGGIPFSMTENVVPLVNATKENNCSAFLTFLGASKSSVSQEGFHLFNGHKEKEENGLVPSARFSMVSLIVSGSATYNYAALSRGIPEEIVDPSIFKEIFITKKERIEALEGSVIKRSFKANLINFDKENSKAIILTLVNQRFESRFQYQFDGVQGHLVSVTDFETRESRKLKAIKLIEKYGNQSSLSSLGKLHSSPHHMVRWYALRALVNLDRTNARNYLLVGQQDKNTEISEKCNSILQAMDEGEIA